MIQDIRETRAVGDHLQRQHFCAEERFRLLSALDVRRGRIPPDQFADFISDGLVAEQKPAISPIFAEQALFDLKRSGLREAILTLAPDSFEIVRMNVPLDSLGGPRALHLFQRSAIEVEQHLVRLKESSFWVQ